MDHNTFFRYANDPKSFPIKIVKDGITLDGKVGDLNTIAQLRFAIQQLGVEPLKIHQQPHAAARFVDAEENSDLIAALQMQLALLKSGTIACSERGEAIAALDLEVAKEKVVDAEIAKAKVNYDAEIAKLKVNYDVDILQAKLDHAKAKSELAKLDHLKWIRDIDMNLFQNA